MASKKDADRQNEGSGKNNVPRNVPTEAGQGGGRKAGMAKPEIMKKDKSSGGLPAAQRKRIRGA